MLLKNEGEMNIPNSLYEAALMRQQRGSLNC